MRMIMQYPGGARVQAAVLVGNPEWMRIVIESQEDTVDLYRVNGRWYLERGPEVEIEALIPLPGTEFLPISEEAHAEALAQPAAATRSDAAC